jgi:ABC-type phosphate transport system permease subunit
VLTVESMAPIRRFGWDFGGLTTDPVAGEFGALPSGARSIRRAGARHRDADSACIAIFISELSPNASSPLVFLTELLAAIPRS